MKKLILMGTVAVFSLNPMFAQNNVEALPQTTQDFIKSNFSSATVKSAEREKDLLNFGNGELYEVVLSNGIKMDFNKAGDLTEIDSRNNERIPDGVLPENIVAYVSENYGSTFIVGWEADKKQQEIVLSDGTELEFDTTGKFLRED